MQPTNYPNNDQVAGRKPLKLSRDYSLSNAAGVDLSRFGLFCFPLFCVMTEECIFFFLPQKFNFMVTIFWLTIRVSQTHF